MTNKQKALSLSQLSSEIKKIINHSFQESIWVKGEISEIHEHRNGNCYLELIEKDLFSDNIITKFRAVIWNTTYKILKPYFEQTTQSHLKSGINILVLVNVVYSDIYGITLNITDIDPAYTLGDMEMRRVEVIQRLTAEGVFDMNKELKFPLVPQRIAVISSETAAGYEDFCNQLNYNEWGFKFSIKLFSAYMQGDMAETSIINAMDQIPLDDFDVLVITRGGGSRSELMCFDSYNLANHVCQFPLPVISAIGHERDISVVDLVANTRVKTPTAAAEFIINRVAQYWEYMQVLYKKVIESAQYKLSLDFQSIEQFAKSIFNVRNILQLKKQQLTFLTEKIHWSVQNILKKQNQQLVTHNLYFQTLSKNVITKQQKHLDNIVKDLTTYSKTFFKQNNQKIFHFEKIIDAYNPKHVLKKGYSITLKNGKTIKSINNVKDGDKITTVLMDGKFFSIVKQ